MITVPDTYGEQPPNDWNWKSMMWLLGRHPRLVQLCNRIPGLMTEENGEGSIHPHLLADAFAAIPKYNDAWEHYARHNPEPGPDSTEQYWEYWRAEGPKPQEFAPGLAALLPMSSGEVACLRMVAFFGTSRIPFTIGDLRSLDEEGKRILADWCEAVKAW